MRLHPIIVLPLLTGCGALPVVWPYTAERSAAISGTLLDERTRTPVAGGEVFFTYCPQLHSKSDRDGRFEIGATQYHYWITWETPAGRVRSGDPPLSSEITITHTNWATQQIRWDQSPQTILLQKLPEPSDVRPWLTFDGNGVILQDGGGVRYLAPKPVMTIPGFAPRPILILPYMDKIDRYTNAQIGPLSQIDVSFAQRVYVAQLTISHGPARPCFTATADVAGFRWGFTPHYDRPSNPVRVEDKSYVYRLEFFR